MERDLPGRRSSYFSGCMMSPVSCFSVHEEIEYSRINNYCYNAASAADTKRGWRWRNLLRKWVGEGKILHGSKPVSFNYDAVSYAQNFDNGCHFEESGHCSRISLDVIRWKFNQEC